MASSERHVFPGGNTSKGFYSLYRYMLSQDEARRIICIKGGPGTGKSSLMKNVGKLYKENGYDIEYHHCSSDPNSLDGVVIKALKVAIFDSTSPHAAVS
jgi:ABC-type lipoprotein export system ATPase subunit